MNNETPPPKPISTDELIEKLEHFYSEGLKLDNEGVKIVADRLQERQDLLREITKELKDDVCLIEDHEVYYCLRCSLLDKLGEVKS